MKIECIFVLIVVLDVVFAVDVCEKIKAVKPKIYSCDKSLMNNRCAIREEILETQYNYYIKDICGKDESCNDGDISTGSYCKTRERRLGFSGEKCAVNPECYSEICKDGKCEGKADEAECSSYGECKAHSYCKSRKCTAIVAANAECSSDNACPVNHVCGKDTLDLASRKCLKMFSIKKGSFASRADLCETGFLYDPNSFTYQRLDFEDNIDQSAATVCAESKLTTPTCSVSGDCTYTINRISDEPGIKLKNGGECQCDGKGLKGHCMIGSTDEIFQNYISLHKSKIDGLTLGENDNISWLRSNEWGNPKLIQAKRDIKFSQVLTDIEKCAIRYVTGSKAIAFSSIALLIMIALF